MDGDEETWAVQEAEDWLELGRIADVMARVLPGEVVEWMEQDNPEEGREHMRILLAGLPPANMDGFLEALNALEAWHRRRGTL
jgi:hypothetical protein